MSVVEEIVSAGNVDRGEHSLSPSRGMAPSFNYRVAPSGYGDLVASMMIDVAVAWSLPQGPQDIPSLPHPIQFGPPVQAKVSIK